MLQIQSFKTMELDAWDIHSESEMDETNLQSANNRKRYRRNKKRRRSKSQSCSSLYSLASMRPSKEQSAPNVAYGRTDDSVDLGILPPSSSTESNAANKTNKAIGTTSSVHSATIEMKLGDSGNGSGSDEPTTTVTIPVNNPSGFKESFLTMIGRLGNWRKCRCKLAATDVPSQQHECGLSVGGKSGSHSSTAKYFRAFSFNGKIFRNNYM